MAPKPVEHVKHVKPVKPAPAAAGVFGGTVALAVATVVGLVVVLPVWHLAGMPGVAVLLGAFVAVAAGSSRRR